MIRRLTSRWTRTRTRSGESLPLFACNSISFLKPPTTHDIHLRTSRNDILRQHKILPPKPPSPTPFIEEAIAQARQEAFDNRLEDATLSDLSALEDSEDEAFIATYRNKRIAELAAITASSDHGIVYPIQKVDYTTDVTEASKDEKCPGVLLLMTSRSGKVESRRLEEVWHHAATKFRNVKFCQIRADMCVEGYPEENTPTVLVYRKGELVKQVVGLAEFGGDKTDLRGMFGLFFFFVLCFFFFFS